MNHFFIKTEVETLTIIAIILQLLFIIYFLLKIYDKEGLKWSTFFETPQDYYWISIIISLSYFYWFHLNGNLVFLNANIVFAYIWISQVYEKKVKKNTNDNEDQSNNLDHSDILDMEEYRH